MESDGKNPFEYFATKKKYTPSVSQCDSLLGLLSRTQKEYIENSIMDLNEAQQI